MDLMLDLDASGDSPRAMANTAEGRFTLLLRDGFLGQRFASLSAVAALRGLLPWDNRQEGTQLLCAMVDLPISEGVATSHVMVLDTDDMLMRGQGEIDLGQERYDLLLRPRPKRNRATGFNANVRITGALTNPRYRLAARRRGDEGGGHSRAFRGARTARAVRQPGQFSSHPPGMRGVAGGSLDPEVVPGRFPPAIWFTLATPRAAHLRRFE